jgi:small GTP-binding protein
MLKTPLKLILIGDGRVGKTSIINKYINNKFNEGEEITVSSSYIEKIQIFNSKKYKFSIWDTAGQEKFNSITPIYYRDAKGVLLVYDITNLNSFSRVKKWREELKTFNNNAIIVIAGNKCDFLNDKNNINKEFVDIDIAKKYANDNNIELFFTSAKNGDNIIEVFENLMEKVFNKFVKNYVPNNKKESNERNIIIKNEEENEENSDCNC